MATIPKVDLSKNFLDRQKQWDTTYAKHAKDRSFGGSKEIWGPRSAVTKTTYDRDVARYAEQDTRNELGWWPGKPEPPRFKPIDFSDSSDSNPTVFQFDTWDQFNTAAAKQLGIPTMAGDGSEKAAWQAGKDKFTAAQQVPQVPQTVAQGQTLYGDVDRGLQEDGTLGGYEDMTPIDPETLEDLGLGIELADKPAHRDLQVANADPKGPYTPLPTPGWGRKGEFTPPAQWRRTLPDGTTVPFAQRRRDAAIASASAAPARPKYNYRDYIKQYSSGGSLGENSSMKIGLNV